MEKAGANDVTDDGKKVDPYPVPKVINIFIQKLKNLLSVWMESECNVVMHNQYAYFVVLQADFLEVLIGRLIFNCDYNLMYTFS